MRTIYTPSQMQAAIRTEYFPEDNQRFEKVSNLIGNLAIPSYVHGYTIAIQYMKQWFESKFDKDFFRGGVFVDGHHVLDDYKRLNDYARKNMIKGENPRARIIAELDTDYDNDSIDVYQGPPEYYLRRSKYLDAFFKDYDRNLYLGFVYRKMRMNFNFKVRVNSKSQQLDERHRMEIAFRNGATTTKYISADIHVPKDIILHIAKTAGFEIVNGEVKEIIPFLEYMNMHSDLSFLFKMRAINLKAEFFIRVNDLYTHISNLEKIQIDNGEQDGKLHFNYNIEMNPILTMGIPSYFAYYSSEDITMGIPIMEQHEGCVAIYSINIHEIPKQDQHGWGRAAITDYLVEKGDTEIDLKPIIGGDNPLARSINHEYTKGVSPSSFVNIWLFYDEDSRKIIKFHIDWKNCKVIFDEEFTMDHMIHIAIYYDRNYINELEIARDTMYHSRLKSKESKH